jgi:hypothetical protein
MGVRKMSEEKSKSPPPASINQDKLAGDPPVAPVNQEITKGATSIKPTTPQNSLITNAKPAKPISPSNRAITEDKQTSTPKPPPIPVNEDIAIDGEVDIETSGHSDALRSEKGNDND